VSEYQLTNREIVVRIRPDGSLSIPVDASNKDYLDYLDWISNGNTPDAYVPPVPQVPASVTPKQARLALSAAGLLTQVNAMVRAAPEATQIAWDYGLSVDRNDPMLLALISQLYPPMTDAQVDQLFISAAAIP
jgi:hypothetical protein